MKARNEIEGAGVREKARAAVAWCRAATAKQGGKPWSYWVIPDDAVSQTSTLSHMLAQAIRDLSGG